MKPKKTKKFFTDDWPEKITPKNLNEREMSVYDLGQLIDCDTIDYVVYTNVRKSDASVDRNMTIYLTENKSGNLYFATYVWDSYTSLSSWSWFLQVYDFL